MKFPFVSRSVYEDMTRIVTDAHIRAANAEQRFDKLFDRYTEFVAEMVASRKPPTYEPLEPAEPDLEPDIWAAIGDRAPINTVAYTQLAHAAMQLQHEGLSPGQIIDRIMQGEEAPI